MTPISAAVVTTAAMVMIRMLAILIVATWCVCSRWRTVQARRSAAMKIRIGDQQEHRRDQLRHPFRPNPREQRVEGQADADRGEPGPHPAGEGPLVGEHRPVLSEIGPVPRRGREMWSGRQASVHLMRLPTLNASA